MRWLREFIAESEKKSGYSGDRSSHERLLVPSDKRNLPQIDTTGGATSVENAFSGSADKAAKQFRGRDQASDSWEWIEERAAILEYEAGFPRDVAEAGAFEMWFMQFVGRM